MDFNGLFTLGAAAADVVTTAAPAPVDVSAWWQTGALALGGMLLMKLFAWISSWIDGKGQVWVHERFTKLQETINTNSVMSQIQADDAVLKIVEAAIPEVLHEIADTAQKDLADGKFDAVDWSGLGARLWLKVKPQIEGGKNDYLKNSSFADGQAVATMIIQRWFKKKLAAKKGLA